MNLIQSFTPVCQLHVFNRSTSHCLHDQMFIHRLGVTYADRHVRPKQITGQLETLLTFEMMQHSNQRSMFCRSTNLITLWEFFALVQWCACQRSRPVRVHIKVSVVGRTSVVMRFITVRPNLSRDSSVLPMWSGIRRTSYIICFDAMWSISCLAWALIQKCQCLSSVFSFQVFRPMYVTLWFQNQFIQLPAINLIRLHYL